MNFLPLLDFSPTSAAAALAHTDLRPTWNYLAARVNAVLRAVVDLEHAAEALRALKDPGGDRVRVVDTVLEGRRQDRLRRFARLTATLPSPELDRVARFLGHHDFSWNWSLQFLNRIEEGLGELHAPFVRTDLLGPAVWSATLPLAMAFGPAPSAGRHDLTPLFLAALSEPFSGRRLAMDVLRDLHRARYARHHVSDRHPLWRAKWSEEAFLARAREAGLGPLLPLLYDGGSHDEEPGR